MRRYFILSLGLVLALVRAPLGAVEPKTAGSHLTSESLLRNGAFAEGVSGWSFSDAPGDRFIVEAGSAANGGVQCLCYRNAADVERAVFSFYQDVRFKAGTYYRLSFKYRGDGRLAPMVLLNDSADKYPHQRMFKLKPGNEWQDYAVEFTAGLHDQRLRIQFYPGSAPNHYLTDRGAVIAGRAGEFRFADIALVETTRRDPPTPPGPLETQAERVIYKKTEKLDLELLVDRPVGLQDPVPVMVMIHGGGWAKGSPEVMESRAQFLAQRGIATVRVQYRLIGQGGNFQKTIGDVMDAIEWVRQNAAAYHFDLKRVGLTGGSAGGHLSAIAAQRTPECNVYVGFCGLYDAFNVGDGHFARRAAFVGCTEAERKAASAIYQIKSPPPATILFHGLADPTIDSNQAVRFATALRARGGRVEVQLNPGCGHEVGNPVVVNERMLTFLNREWHLRMKL